MPENDFFHIDRKTRIYFQIIILICFVVAALALLVFAFWWIYKMSYVISTVAFLFISNRCGWNYTVQLTGIAAIFTPLLVGLDVKLSVVLIIVVLAILLAYHVQIENLTNERLAKEREHQETILAAEHGHIEWVQSENTKFDSKRLDAQVVHNRYKMMARFANTAIDATFQILNLRAINNNAGDHNGSLGRFPGQRAMVPALFQYVIDLIGYPSSHTGRP